MNGVPIETTGSCLPSLRISTALACNHRCSFCQTGGDYASVSIHANEESPTRLSESIQAFVDLGVRHFSFTGGEPLLKPDVTFSLAEMLARVLRHRDSRSPDGYIRLNTNGALIANHVERIAESFDLVKVSLHSLDRKQYAAITGSRRPEADYAAVMCGIDQLHQLDVPIRVQHVVTTSTYPEVPEIIKFCEDHPGVCEVKLFDVSEYSELWRGHQDGHAFWRQAYQSLHDLEDGLWERYEFLGYVFSVGGFGNPMSLFRTDTGLIIRVRRSDVGASYSASCRHCSAYAFCRDGHCNLELGLNGVIKVCRPKEGKAFRMGEEEQAIRHIQRSEFSERSAYPLRAATERQSTSVMAVRTPPRTIVVAAFDGGLAGSAATDGTARQRVVHLPCTH